MADKKLEKERIVHNILSKYAKDKGFIKYEYSDGFYCFGNPDSQELADKKHEEWLKKNGLTKDNGGLNYVKQSTTNQGRD